VSDRDESTIGLDRVNRPLVFILSADLFGESLLWMGSELRHRLK